MTLTQVLAAYLRRKVGVSALTSAEYRRTIDHVRRWFGSDPPVAGLTEDLLADFLNHRLDAGRANHTLRKDRDVLVMLLGFAFRRGWVDAPPRDPPVVDVPRPNPTAWTPQQVARILAACRSSSRLPGWDERHWRALVSTIYDSSERITPLLKVPLSNLDLDSRTLFIPGAMRKRRNSARDMEYALHPETIDLIRDTIDGHRGLLFPWPLQKRSLWIHFKRILAAAGLPSTSRDLFHRLRRTSYTQVYKTLGRDAATQHAGHSRDLSAYYLDSSQLPTLRAAEAIPRPA